MTGYPGFTMGCGFSSEAPKRPLALQIYGPPFSEARLLQVAHAYQERTGWHEELPPIQGALRSPQIERPSRERRTSGRHRPPSEGQNGGTPVRTVLSMARIGRGTSGIPVSQRRTTYRSGSRRKCRRPAMRNRSDRLPTGNASRPQPIPATRSAWSAAIRIQSVRPASR